ncbi:MAG: DUF2802 domain-containing protein [Candidatus Sedimenticola endophacoides]
MSVPEWVTMILLLLLAGGLALLGLERVRQRRHMATLERRLEYLSSNFNILCAGALGVEQRVNRLEQRQDSMETQQGGEQPYGDAIRLVHQGANAGRLVDELGLSRSEADLLVMLHGEKESL